MPSKGKPSWTLSSSYNRVITFYLEFFGAHPPEAFDSRRVPQWWGKFLRGSCGCWLARGGDPPHAEKRIHPNASPLCGGRKRSDERLLYTCVHGFRQLLTPPVMTIP